MTDTDAATQVDALDLRIPARDGFALGATVHEPAGEESAWNGHVVLVSSATAAPRRFYRHFAGALVEAGYRVVTYDYRGIGESRPRSLRGFEARMRDWCFLDMAGVVDWIGEELTPDRLFHVGHSVGGQVAGMLPEPERFDGMVTVSAQSGYWRVQGGLQKLPVGLHVWVTLPVLSRLVGYMPWSWMGSAEDLPAGVALEWSGWCRHPDYLLGDPTLPLERYAGFTAPVLAYSIGDDDWGTARSVDRMMRAYRNVERRHVDPVSAGVGRLGHFGWFRPAARSLWAEPIAWMDALAAQPRGDATRPAALTEETA